MNRDTTRAAMVRAMALASPVAARRGEMVAYLAAIGKPMPVARIARHCEVSKATIERDLSALRRQGVLDERQADGHKQRKVYAIRVTP